MGKALGLACTPLLLLLTACPDYGPGQVAPPDAITVQKAFQDVADGLVAFRKTVDSADPATGDKRRFGLIGCRIIVKFNIAASANQSTKGAASLAAPIESFKLSASADVAALAAAQRGNVVIVDLGSIFSDTCSAYEKPSDMFPSPAPAPAAEKAATDDEGASSGGGAQAKPKPHQGNNPSPQPKPPTTGMLLQMIVQRCEKHDKEACNILNGALMTHSQ